MNSPKTGFLVGVALAAGLALGLVGSALAADPTASPGYPSMMSGSAMMGGLSQERFSQIVSRCDQMHDAMRDALSATASNGQVSR